MKNIKCSRSMMTLLALAVWLIFLPAMQVRAASLKVKSTTENLTVYSRQLLVTTDTKKVKLRAYYNGTDVTTKAKWKSSRAGIVQMSDKGKLKIRKAGTSVITCKYKGETITTRVVVVKNTHMSGIPSSKEEYIREVASVAVQLYPYTKILPSVVIAQCCLETGYGLGKDSRKLMKKNNLLGMKAYLLDESWSQWSVWDGKKLKKKTPEYIEGKLIYITDSFRAYPDYCTCIIDYEQFLMRVKYQGVYKYRKIRGKTSSKKVITMISKGGYATDPSYITKVMRIIKENNLRQYDPAVQ